MRMSSPRLNRCSSESVCRAPACPPAPGLHSVATSIASPSSLLPFFFLLQLSRAAAPSLPHAPLEASGGPRATPKCPSSSRRKCPYRYCQVHGPAAQRRRAAGTVCDAVHGEHVVQRLTADMTCLLPPTAANSQRPPPTHGPFCSSRDIGLPINGRIAWPLPALALAMAFCFFAFCWCRPSPARPSPVLHLAPSTCHQRLVFLELLCII